MEAVLNNGFCEISEKEKIEIDGGMPAIIVLLGKAAFAGFCWGAGYWITDKIIG